MVVSERVVESACEVLLRQRMAGAALPWGGLSKWGHHVGVSCAGFLSQARWFRSAYCRIFCFGVARIYAFCADLFMADLSYALIDNIVARNAQFYNAILFNTQIKNCDLSGANFANADLNRVRFKNTTLFGADFTNAYNIPNEIKEKLNDGKYYESEPVTTNPQQNGKKVFFSIPGCMTKEDECLIKDYKKSLEAMGYDVVYYKKNDYPKYGQLNKIRHSIEASDAMVVFGLKQINIVSGSYHKNTSQEKDITNKWMSTPWNELEVGMGLMAELPILLIKDNDIDSGIFDENLSECFIASISTDVDCRKLETNKPFISLLAKF